MARGRGRWETGKRGSSKRDGRTLSTYTDSSIAVTPFCRSVISRFVSVKRVARGWGWREGSGRRGGEGRTLSTYRDSICIAQ